MTCPFIKHGLAIAYDRVAKPCCEWQYDQHYARDNLASEVDLSNWHGNLKPHADLLAAGRWPQYCSKCETSEKFGTSLRLNGISAYQHYQEGDITLEIRPGSVCNFACQTCWPAASSRVANFYRQAGLDYTASVPAAIENFDFLHTIAHRVKDVVLLGGEPFYDPGCTQFLAWAQRNLRARLTMFTNGSSVDWNFVNAFGGQLVLVFSLDAVGPVAEYVRFGTDWPTVLGNYQRSLQTPHVETRVNVTTSVFNYLYLGPLIELLVQQWPHVVTWGEATKSIFTARVCADKSPILQSLHRCLDLIHSSSIPHAQRSHAHSFFSGLITKINQLDYCPEVHQDLKQFVTRLDGAKKLHMRDHCADLADLLQMH